MNINGYTTSECRIKFNIVDYDNILQINEYKENANIIEEIDYNDLSKTTNIVYRNSPLYFDLAELCV